MESFGENIIYVDNDKEFGKGAISISRRSDDPNNPGITISVGVVSKEPNREVKLPITVSEDKTSMTLIIDNLAQYATLKTFVRDLYAFLYKEPKIFNKDIKDGDVKKEEVNAVS